MNLFPSDEEAQLQDTMRRFANDHSGVGAHDPAERYDQAYRTFASLGGAGMAIAESKGGFGVTHEGLALAAFELGAMPLAAPRIEQVIAVARLLEASEGERAEALRDSFIAGDRHIVLADWEGVGVHGFAPVHVRAERGAGGARIYGVKSCVVGAGRADTALVTAQADGERGLFAVRLDPRCGTVEHRLADLTPVADLTFDGAPGEPLLTGAAFEAAWDRARDQAIVSAAAASAGSMTAAIRLTVDYLKVRRQFGAALADFQALQQRVADLFIMANEARSSVYAAVAALHKSPAVRSRTVSGCKLKVARAARHVTGEAIHLHGGIGFTAEYQVGHHHRRALVDEMLFGDPAFHLERYLCSVETSADVATDTPYVAVLAPAAARR